MNACDEFLNASLMRALAMGALVSREIAPDEAKRVARVGRQTVRGPGPGLDDDLTDRLSRMRDTVFERVSAASVWALCAHDESFPTALSDLPDGPQVVFGGGATTSLKRLSSEPAVALVGARRASPSGREITYRLGRELAAAGVTVVSGMAFGIDAAAHRGALNAGGLTVAVLAGSPGTAYPAAHAALHRQIAEAGVVLSEFPPGARVARWGFPARNRLIAALATVTVAVEGREGSGALHTTEFATQLGRVVAAVPGTVTSPLSALPNGLLYDGAQLVRDGRDLLELLFGPQLPQSALFQPPGPDLDPELSAVLAAVREGAFTPADVAAALAPTTPVDARRMLGRLELLGVVRREGSGSYVALA